MSTIDVFEKASFFIIDRDKKCDVFFSHRAFHHVGIQPFYNFLEIASVIGKNGSQVGLEIGHQESSA